MSTFSIGGLSTGLDTKKIISQLIQIESAPKTKLEWNKALWQARSNGWSDLNTRLLSLQSMANTIMNPKTWDQTAAASTDPYTATSSDPSRVAATLTNPTPATSATYYVEVQQLARGEVSQSTGSLSGGVLSNDTLTITQGSNTWNVALATGDAMSDIAAKINAVSGIGISASVNAGVLQLSSLTQGAASAFAITSSGSTATDLGLTETQTAQDARYTVNGTAYTNASNYGATAGMTDVSVDLFQTTMAPATITVGQGAPSGASAQDTWVNATKKKITDFVNQYNNVLDFISTKSGEQKVVSPKNLGDYLSGPLSRDYQFSSVGFDLQKQVGNVVSGLPQGGSMLSDIGITTSFTMGAGSSNKLVIDDAALDAALRADPQKVRDILGKVGATPGISADDGIVRRVSELVSNLRTGGKVDTAMQGMTNQMSSLQSSIDKFTMRLANKQTYYERMFASMETTIGRMQSQMSSLSGTFNSLMQG